MRPPTSRSICGDVSGKRLSARRADTRNVETCRSPRSSRIGLRDDVDVERHERRAREIRDAEHAPQPIGHRAPRRPAEPSTTSMRPIFGHHALHVEIAPSRS